MSCRLTAVAVRRQSFRPRGLPGGAGEVGGDDVGRVPVQAPAGAVVPHHGPRIGVRGGLLYISQRDPGIQRDGVRLVVDSGPSHVGGGRAVQEPFFDGVLVEPTTGLMA